MEVVASVPSIICIAQITCEFVYYTLLVDQGRLFLCDSQMISDLFSCEHRLYKYSFPLFPIYSSDNDDMKSLKHCVVLLSLLFSC